MEFELYVLRNVAGVMDLGGGGGRSPSLSASIGSVRVLVQLEGEPFKAKDESARPIVSSFCTRGSLPSSAVWGRSPLPFVNSPWAFGALATLLSFLANSSLVLTGGPPSGPFTLRVRLGVSGGLGGTESWL